jgi:hypothetical protein
MYLLLSDGLNDDHYDAMLPIDERRYVDLLNFVFI